MSSKVSVIIPIYNQEKYIEECINSVLNQTYTNIEIIVINDCSTDSSLNLVNTIKDDRIRIISLEKHSGVSIARNKGIELATGEYIAFLDSDDYWVPEKIEKQIDFIKRNNYEFIYGSYTFLKKDLKKNTVYVPEKLIYEEAIKNTTIFVSTVMLDMKKISKEELYMPNVEIGQDSVTWWRILKRGRTAYGMQDVLAYYRVWDKSLSSNKIKAVFGAWKNYFKEDIPLFKKIYCFLCYIKNAIKRRI